MTKRVVMPTPLIAARATGGVFFRVATSLMPSCWRASSEDHHGAEVADADFARPAGSGSTSSCRSLRSLRSVCRPTLCSSTAATQRRIAPRDTPRRRRWSDSPRPIAYLIAQPNRDHVWLVRSQPVAERLWGGWREQSSFAMKVTQGWIVRMPAGASGLDVTAKPLGWPSVPGSVPSSGVNRARLS